MLFIDYSLAFNSIVFSKLGDLGLQTSFCNWVVDLLRGRPQGVRIGSHITSLLILKTGVPQGCMLGPLLYSLVTANLGLQRGSEVSDQLVPGQRSHSQSQQKLKELIVELQETA